jgi:hypothetical protein
MLAAQPTHAAPPRPRLPGEEVGVISQTLSVSSYNKAGGASANLVTRKAPGFYVVTCKKIGAFAGKRSGHVQVTASGIDATWCKVVTWGGGSGADLNAQVECRNPAGALADSYFDFLYVR